MHPSKNKPATIRPENLLSLFLILTISLTHTGNLLAQEVPRSPKKPWGPFEVVEEEEPYWLTEVVLWVPNRILDLVDIFKFDIGGGLSLGAMVRFTPAVQIGYRTFDPYSLRIGNFGRAPPYMIERTEEFSYLFKSRSGQRDLCPEELGLSLDVFIAGVSVGVCLVEAADFLTGIFLVDLRNDDLS